jgi:hypothetical protein
MTVQEIEEKLKEFAAQLKIPFLGWNIGIEPGTGKPTSVYFSGRIQS